MKQCYTTLNQNWFASYARHICPNTAQCEGTAPQCGAPRVPTTSSTIRYGFRQPEVRASGTMCTASISESVMGLRIAARWFDLERLSDGVTRVWEPHVIRVMQCNIWHVQGRSRDLLIDTGMGIASLREAAAQILTKPLTALATHTHLDHVGSLHEFSDRVVHATEAQTLLRSSGNFSMLREDHPVEFITGLERAGYEVGPCFITALPRADFHLRSFTCPAAPATRVVDEGDMIDLGNRRFEVMHLPGHSPGSIGLWEAATGIFFSGDAIYDGPLLDELPGSDVNAYLRTMRRLEQLPARIVHAGHDPSFDGVRLRQLARAYLERRS